MKFLYKIHSRYDGFSPRRIPDRAIDGKVLELGWQRYFEEVEEEDEVWIYFHGGSFSEGVYVKGSVVSKDAQKEVVNLLIEDYSTTAPLTDNKTSRQVGEIVSVRYRQVFFVPDEWKTVANCSLSTTAISCATRLCRDCATWRRLPQVDPRMLNRPWRMGEKTIAAFSPAYWAIPPRSFLYYAGRTINPGVEHTSGLFRRFKVGDKNLAFPFALGIVQALKRSRITEFDAIVPIPLSPEKVVQKELHRALVLSQEVGRLLGVPVVELLSLENPIGKRALKRLTGAGPEAFESAYARELRAEARAKKYSSLLVIDDVCTEGSTLECAALALIEVNPTATIYAATAAQMAVRAVVSDEDPLYA